MNNQEMPRLEMSELDFEFEPMTRTRSNTWPLPRPEGYIEPTLSTTPSNEPQIERTSSNGSNDSAIPSPSSLSTSPSSTSTSTSSSSHSKGSSSRSAHGNASYAELITRAISTSKDQRLTLQEIYNWMMKNVPSIAERKDQRAWQNSVRHNLSLHKRFLKVPNESAGKSCWWTIDPNETLQKTSRRRCSSMEPGKLQKIRNQAKKNAQTLQLNQQNQELSQMTATYVDTNTTNHLVQQMPNTCTVYYQTLDTIPQVPEEAEYVPQYSQPYGNVVPMLQTTTVQTNPVMVTEVLDSNSNPFGLKRYNSLLDDIMNIIAHDMTM